MEHKKRFVIIFDVWTHLTFSREILEFDNEKDMHENSKLIDEVYEKTKITRDVYGEARQWGYVCLDFDREKILKWSKTGKIWDCSKVNNKLELLDKFFRKEGEIPKDYKWDIGEYEGWLQFRWGDGKNAIDYKKPSNGKPKSQCLSNMTAHDDEYDAIQNSFDELSTKEKINLKINKW